MVGVAGKSRGCHSCRRRRVKCDFQRPSCLRCEKAKIPCAGYERGHVFVNRTQTERSVTAASVILETKRREKKHVPVPVFEEDLRWLVSQAKDPRSQSYNRVDFRRRGVKILKKLYLPRPHPETYSHLIGSTCTWLDVLDALTEESRALDLAIVALCIVQTRLTNTSSLSLEEGLQFYSDALRHHRTDLQDEEKLSRDESLAVIVVLTTCEIFGSQFEDAWRIHALGTSEILRLRDQAGRRTETWSSLCSRLRIVCMVDGLTKQQPLFFTSSEWLDFSNNIYSQPIDRLMDSILPVPGLLAEANALMDGPHRDQQDDHMISIVKDLIDIINQLYCWQHQARIDWSRTLYWAVPSQLHNPADDTYHMKIFPFALEFDSLDVAIMLTFAWSLRLQMYNKIMHMYRWLHDDPNHLPHVHEIFEHDEAQLDLDATSTEKPYYIPPDNFSIHVIEAEAEKVSRLICQSLGYCHRTAMGTLGPQCCRYPQWVLRQFFAQKPSHEKELEWILEMKNLTGPGLHVKLEMAELQDSQ